MSNVSTPPAAKTRYRAVFISPHLDDAVFSCGGEIARLVTEGPVLVLNIFTRYLSDVKMRGVVLNESRYEEEVDASRFLGFESRNLGELDVSFRRKAYRKLGNIFHPPVTEDVAWLSDLRAKVFAVLAELDYQQLYVPLGIGWHVDHVLTYQVFEPWAARNNLLFYEDAPYCCIPHATRYRLNGIANYHRALNDASLESTHELRAWWQASMAYADTALMKNLQPWLLRQVAVPAVSYYLFRLMAYYRSNIRTAEKRSFSPVVMPIANVFTKKIDAMSLYRSQFSEFFSSRPDCIDTLTNYAKGMGESADTLERYWLCSDVPIQFQ